MNRIKLEGGNVMRQYDIPSFSSINGKNINIYGLQNTILKNLAYDFEEGIETKEYKLKYISNSLC